jgi:hypothetical protein
MFGGQTWDQFSPLRPTVNDDTHMLTAGNTGLRRPQLMIGYNAVRDTGGLSAVGGIGLTGAVDSGDRDIDGVLDGEASGRPHWQGRVAYSLPYFGQMGSLGLSGAYGFLRTRARALHATIANLDFTVPLARFLQLRGEAWIGTNMSDYGGGPRVIGPLVAIGEDDEVTVPGQVIGIPFPGRVETVRGRGGWAELSFRPLEKWSIHPGLTIDDPRDATLPAGIAGVLDVTRNRAFYVANRVSAGDNLTIGVDYLRWKTNFAGLRRGIDDRVNLFFKYSF